MSDSYKRAIFNEKMKEYRNENRVKLWSQMELPQSSAFYTTKRSGASKRQKKCFQRQPFRKYLRITLVSMWNSALRQKFNFSFSRFFLLVLTKFSYWWEDWALGYHFMRFRDFPDISQFLKILGLRLGLGFFIEVCT